MADQLINSFSTGSIADNSLGVIGDPVAGTLTQTSYHAMKDYFTAGVTGPVLPTSSFNTFSSSYTNDSGSFNQRINNSYASESNYLPTGSFINFSASLSTQLTGSAGNVYTGSLLLTSSFNIYTSSTNGEIVNVYASESNYLLTGSFNTFSQSLSIQVNNIFSSESNYTSLTSFNSYTGSTSTQIANVYASQSNYETTGSLSAYSSSTAIIINNVYLSESNYTSLASFNAYTSSTSGLITNVFSSQSNYESTSSFTTYSSSTATTIANVYASESNYNTIASFNTYTSSTSTTITNVYASESKYLPTSSFVNIGTFSGSGTSNYLSYYSSSTSLTSSLFYQSGSSILIGGTIGSSSAILQIYGGTYHSGAIYDSTQAKGSTGQVLGVGTNGPLWVNTASAVAASVTTVSNIDNSLTVSPISGSVTASINTSANFLWRGTHTFSSSIVPSGSTNFNLGSNTNAFNNIYVGGINPPSNLTIALNTNQSMAININAATKFSIAGNGIGVGGITATTSSFLSFSACSVSSSHINFASGSTPTTPHDGDIWYSSGSYNTKISGSISAIVTAASASAPANTGSAVLWAQVTYLGNIYKMPLYQ